MAEEEEVSIQSTEDDKVGYTMKTKDKLTNEQLTSRFKTEAKLPTRVRTLYVQDSVKGDLKEQKVPFVPLINFEESN